MTQSPTETTTTNPEVRPFSIDVSEAALVDLRRRIAATQWPEKETVADESQGVPLATMQELARYWATDYDWRKCEAKLKALPHFITEIDGLDIHFIHVRSKHENALPLPTFLTAWIVSAGTKKTSSALTVVGGSPSTWYSSDPSRT